jgi:hypothetical protein
MYTKRNAPPIDVTIYMFCVVKGWVQTDRQVHGRTVEWYRRWISATCPPPLRVIRNEQIVVALVGTAEDAAPGYRKARCLSPGRAPRELPWSYCNPQVLLPVSHRTPSLWFRLPFVHMITHTEWWMRIHNFLRGSTVTFQEKGISLRLLEIKY